MLILANNVMNVSKQGIGLNVILDIDEILKFKLEIQFRLDLWILSRVILKLCGIILVICETIFAAILAARQYVIVVGEFEIVKSVDLSLFLE